MKTEIKELNLKEMENAGGGVILYDLDKYWVFSDNTCIFLTKPFDTLEEAQAAAREAGYKANLYNRPEFEKTFGKFYNW